MWTWNPGPLQPWETLLVTLGEMNRVMTEGKALIAQPIFFFLKIGNFFIKYKVEQFYMGLSLLSLFECKVKQYRTLNVPLKYPELCPLFLYSF